MVRGLHHESAIHSEYIYEPTINISATLATPARDAIGLDYFCRIGVSWVVFLVALADGARLLELFDLFCAHPQDFSEDIAVVVPYPGGGAGRARLRKRRDPR